MPNKLSDTLFPAVVNLVNSIPRKYRDPHQQAVYEKGYLVAVLNSIYLECFDARTLIKHKLRDQQEPSPENSRDAW